MDAEAESAQNQSSERTLQAFGIPMGMMRRLHAEVWQKSSFTREEPEHALAGLPRTDKNGTVQAGVPVDEWAWSEAV